MKNIRITREEIALARVSHACLEQMKQEVGQAVSLEDILPIVAPQNFAGQKRRRSLCRHFLPGGEFGNNVFGSTTEELLHAATVIFAGLEPLAKKGFKETGKPNAYAYLASKAYGIFKQRRAA
jgi:hypothetical protein